MEEKQEENKLFRLTLKEKKQVGRNNFVLDRLLFALSVVLTSMIYYEEYCAARRPVRFIDQHQRNGQRVP